MLKKLLTSAVFAGLGAGLIAAALQLMLLTPLLLEGEEYESGNKVHFGEVVEISEPDAVDTAYAEPSALARHSQTVLWNAGTYFGFALLLVAGMGAASQFGHEVSARSGMVWGVAGFVAFQFAPAVGLPPELPGAWAADLHARQIWQVFTMVATALGLAGLAFGNNAVAWGIGLAMIAVPHVVGAPQPDEFGGVAPPELAAHFASVSLAVGLATWAGLGLIAGYFWQKSEA